MADIDEPLLAELLGALTAAMQEADAAKAEADAKGEQLDRVQLMHTILVCSANTARLLGELTGGRCAVALLIAAGAVRILEHAVEVDGQTEQTAAVMPALELLVRTLIDSAPSGGDDDPTGGIVIPFRGRKPPKGDLN